MKVLSLEKVGSDVFMTVRYRVLGFLWWREREYWRDANGNWYDAASGSYSGSIRGESLNQARAVYSAQERRIEAIIREIDEPPQLPPAPSNVVRMPTPPVVMSDAQFARLMSDVQSFKEGQRGALRCILERNGVAPDEVERVVTRKYGRSANG